MDAVHPLIQRQRELLRILNEERRLRHRELKNEGITQRTFTAGDLVIVKKQVKSRAADGIAAKIVFKSCGPYRVLEPANPGSYWVQKLPFLEGLGVPGKRVKESTARMEKIPSTLILHKRPDGADTRFASMRHPLTESPLEQFLGVTAHGNYRQAPALNNFAFDRIEDLWDEPLDVSGSDEEVTTETLEGPRVPLPEAVVPVPQGRRQALTSLYTTIRRLKDKLCFIQYQPDGQTTLGWFIVQVNLDRTNPIAATQQGVYWVHWLI
jgi:hypothetical protein